ncbi:hypothetical protein K1719_020317 [Acacia pycnantha]|nr:hypothetical protein K1719_020317 [Acacia pycnantha]
MVRRVLSKNMFILSSISSSLSSVRPLIFQICHFPSSLNSSSLLRRHYHESRNIPVSVWWDFENCNPPSDVNVFKIHHFIKEAVRGKGILGPLKIRAFGDVYRLSRAHQEALASTGIKIIHVPKGGKNSADKSLLIDLMFWVSQNPPPAHLFLISGDKDFGEVLHRLRMNNYNILIAGIETSHLLCNVATIVWHWNSLLRGESLDGKHFNHPPDGLYGSWCDHHDATLEDDFLDGKQFTRSQTQEFPEPNSRLNVRPIPKEVVRQLYQILKLYPNGISLSLLPTLLERAGICLDKDFYGYKRFSLFLSSVVCVYLQFHPDRGLVAHYVPKEYPEPIESSYVPSTELVENEELNHVATSTELDDTSEKLNADDKYAEPTKKEPLTFLGWIKSWWPFRKKVGNTHNLTAHGNEMVSNAKEPELSNLKQRVSHSEELQSLKQRQMASQFKEPELSELGQTVNHYGEPELFSCSSFWKEVESLVFSSKGAILVFHSRSRKDMALSFKKYGPHVLHSLSENDLLLLVDLLISEKKWLEERPSQTFPFRAIPSRTTRSNLQKSSEFEVDKNQSIPHAGVSSPATRKRHTKKSRIDIIADVKKLVRELLRAFPEGCNMGLIPTRFQEKYGYPLDLGKLECSKLSLLIQTLPGVTTESCHFFPANYGLRDSGKETSTLKTQQTQPSEVVYHYSENEFYDSHYSPWEELGLVSVSNSNKSDLESNPSEKAIELKTAIDPVYEPDFSEDDYSELGGGDNSCLTQSEYDHVFPANHGTRDSGKETSIRKTQETELYDVVCHYSEDEFFDSYSEDDRKDSPWEESGPVSVSNPDESDLESKPGQEAIELKTAIGPDYGPDLSDDDSSDSGGDHSCLTQSEEEGEPRLNGEDSSLQNLDPIYDSQEGEDSVNLKKANTEGIGLADGLNAPRISTPATSSGIHLGSYKEKHKHKRNSSFDDEPVSHQNKELIEGILRCLKRADDVKMPN